MSFAKHLTEREAAARFVKDILSLGEQNWPNVVDQLARAIGADASRVRDDPAVSFEFAAASLAVESAAISNLLPEDQARRVLAFVIEFLDLPQLQGRAMRAFEHYFSIWHASLQTRDMPFAAVAAAFCSRVHIKQVKDCSVSEAQSPLLLLALGDAITRNGGAWWKNALEQYQLVEQ